MSKSYIVTGGAGFIGCNIAMELNRRGSTDIIIVDELNHDEKQKNLDSISFKEYLDKDDFRTKLAAGSIAPVDTVIHMGACSSTTETDAEYLTDNNVRYTQELCQWCLDNNIRFIYASSAATYGDGSLGYSDADEVTPSLKPLNLYGQSKQDFDMWAMENKLLDRIVGLKFFNVYGPHEDHKGYMRSVFNKAYTEIKENGEIKLFKSYKDGYADGEQERDFVYVRDAVSVVLYFDENRDVSGIFNCGTGCARTWVDLAKSLFAAMNTEPKISFIEMPQELQDKYQYHTQADMSKLRTTGYTQEFTSVEDGARDYVLSYLSKRG